MSERLDAHLVRVGLARSRAQAVEAIRAGRVLVDGITARKAAAVVATTAHVEVVGPLDDTVGRGAVKLAHALHTFTAPPGPVPVAGARCLDVGASTGGFTQVLLRAGAGHVVALDVGHGQLAPALVNDPRVTNLERCNIRTVAPEQIGAPFAVVVADLSFIPTSLVLPELSAMLEPGGHLVVLVKPQFEVGRERLGRGGVVRSAADRRRALSAAVEEMANAGVTPCGVTPSPIRGAHGNAEYLVWGVAGDGGRATGEQSDRAALVALAVAQEEG